MEQTIGKRIAEHRKRLKLTQDQLAEMLGVTAQAVSKWENDQSCPDINTLPKLAEIFDISTDELLGYHGTNVVHEAEVVDNSTENTYKDPEKETWTFHWEPPKRSSLTFAGFVLLVGVLYLLAQIMDLQLSFWSILWPTAFFVHGFCGLFSRFSFFRVLCLLFGGYNLAEKFFSLSYDVDGPTIWAILIILFGISLLVDALKKPRLCKKIARHFSGKTHANNLKYTCTDDSFVFTSSFDDKDQRITSQMLRKGEVDVRFGDYVIDLSGVSDVTTDCIIRYNCSFGDLSFLVPQRFQALTKHDTTFSDIEIIGHPDAQPVGVIQLVGNCSFGDITIRYI